jgi:hypothetical protein
MTAHKTVNKFYNKMEECNRMLQYNITDTGIQKIHMLFMKCHCVI